MTTRTIPDVRPERSRTQLVAGALCWVTVVLEGYDLVTLGAVIPTLLETKHLGMTPADATLIATLSLVGVGLGAATVGPLADRLGRRVSLIGSIVLFSVLTALLPLAPSVATFAALRLLAGLGLGACMPTALTIMSEVTPARHRAKATTITMTGYHTGAVLTSLLALAVIPNWQVLFYAGGVIGLLIVPVMWFTLPESSPVVTEGARARVPLSTVVRPPYLRASLGAWVASFMGLLLVYGLNTWLPTIMREAGYQLGAALTMLFILNLGAVAGLLVSGWVGDTRGIKRSGVVWFGLAAVFLALLSIKMESSLLLDIAIFFTGVFVFSAQVLVYALVAHLFQPAVRGTALGLSSGIGRLGAIIGPAVTGALVTAGIAYPWGFYFFALVAVLAVGAVIAMPAHLDEDADEVAPVAR